ncbi:MAG: hypothetical protein M3451_09400, partial [Chloroflexota bacterium]|nr:hypothetical protein [Chloroflexota bacterium]
MRQRSIRLLPTLPDPASMSAASTLIDRFAGRDNHATCLRYLVPEEVRQSPSPGIMLADTSLNKDVLPRLTPDGGSIWHVIWVQDEANTTATVETVSGTSTWPIAPGDSLRVPAGANLRPTGGQLGILISRSGQETSTELPPPT